MEVWRRIWGRLEYIYIFAVGGVDVVEDMGGVMGCLEAVWVEIYIVVMLQIRRSQWWCLFCGVI